MTITPLFPNTLTNALQSRGALLLEIMALRHQVLVLQRQQKKRIKLTLWDRIFWSLLYRLWPRILESLVIVQPATVILWHRKGFRAFWRWKSQPKKPGRKPVPKEIRDLIRRICRENPLWSAPRIHGELLKLGYKVTESSVSKYIGLAEKSTVSNLENLP